MSCNVVTISILFKNDLKLFIRLDHFLINLSTSTSVKIKFYNFFTKIKLKKREVKFIVRVYRDWVLLDTMHINCKNMLNAL